MPDEKVAFDVFLSHNSKDKPAVRQIAEALRDGRGFKVWLDEWELPPGVPWQDELENIIRTVRSAAVLVGKDGLGPWEIPEMRACFSEMVDRRLRVIQVLLPDAPAKPGSDLSSVKQLRIIELARTRFGPGDRMTNGSFDAVNYAR